MKISIVVPVYNVEKYLQQCVESLLNQTYSNTEIVLVDDGSKDSSGQICDEFAHKYSDKIKAVHKKNEGLGYARNTGMEYVTSEYVTFIDSDDYADPDLVEQLYKAAVNFNADVVIGGFKRVDNTGNMLYKEQYDEQIYKGDDVSNQLFMRMLGSSPEKSDAIRMSVWNAMYSMKVIRKYNVKFPSEIELISEDIIFDSEFYPYAQCGVIIPSIAYNYRVNEKSLTAEYRHDRFEKNMILYKELEIRVKELKMPEIACFRAQRQMFVNVRSCIRQENPSISGLSIKQARVNILNICNNVILIKVIKNYPLDKLSFKQSIFVRLLKYKCGNTLLLCSVLKLF